MRVLHWLESAWRDARYGVRQLRRSPTLMLAVLFSLTIGVGANTAIFGLVDAALLRPLPLTQPEALAILQWTAPDFPPGADNHNGEFITIAGNRRQGSSVPAIVYRRLAREQTAFAPLIGVGAYLDPVAVSSDAFPAEQVGLQYVSDNFFQGLGIAPALGRPFQAGEDRVGAEPVVIVSHRFWTNRLGRSREALDRILRINNVPARVVGVAPAGFFGLRAGNWPDVYAPLAAKVAFQAPSAGATSGAAPLREDDRNWWVRIVGRVKPGLTASAATMQINGQFRAFATPEGQTVDPQAIPNLIALPGARGFDALAERDINALWILMLLVAVLLMLVCANVANLLLSRAVGRQRESAMRLALGAARLRLFRQHLIESGVLAIAGGAVGLALGYAFAQIIHLLFQTGRDASYTFDLHVDARMLLFSSALSVLTAFLFGLAPAVRAARADLGETLKSGTRSVMGGLSRLPRALVSVQIALCLCALVAAGLLVRSLENLTAMDVGFDREQLAYATVSPSRAGYTPDRIGPYVDRVRETLNALPGVVRVSPLQTRLLSGGGNYGVVNMAGQPYRQDRGAHLNRVGDEFFETLGIRLLSGRTPTRADLQPDTEAVVIDELFASRYFPNENPLGRRFGMGPKDNRRYEIVGVVANSRYNSLRNDVVPAFYQPYRPSGTVHFAIRTSGNPAALAEAVRRAVASIDPAVPLSEFHTQTALIDRLLRTERLLGFLSMAFGLVALTLAAVGLGGLLAYAVARRTNEIGVRMALGAAARDVVRLVLRDSLWMVGAGIAIGLPCAYAIARILRTSLFQLEPFDPLTLASALLALFLVALLAAWIPAFRAARIDPVTALRQD